MIRGISVHISSATPKEGTSSGHPGMGYRGPPARAGNMAMYGQQQQQYGMQQYTQQQQQQQQQQRGGMSQEVIANMGTFSEAVISAAQSALAQQGWGSFIDAVMPSKGAPGGKQGNGNAYGGAY